MDGTARRRGPGVPGPGPAPEGGASLDRVATVPNLISLLRILLIPVFVVLLTRPDTQLAGLLLLGFTVATDWVDGYVARRTGQVSNLGKLLDPVADRLALAAALLTLAAVGALPWWAAGLVLVRDATILAGGLFALRRGVRIDVRLIGKLATFALMVGIPLIAWANFGLGFHEVIRPIGWACYWVGIVAYYAALGVYARDVRRALAGRYDGGP